MPPFQSTAASGTLPIEHTKLATAMTGPINGPQTFDHPPSFARKRWPQKLSGTHAATAPAMSRPIAMSRTTASHSITKMWLTLVAPAGETSRRRKDPSPPTVMSMAAWPSIDPAAPWSAWSLAACTTRERRKSRKHTATTTIISGPPTNSARVNCQPSSSARITPSSTTRLVLAISKTIAAVKLAPLRKRERASATAAYEQEELAIPKPVARASVTGRSSPRVAMIVSRRTSACTIAEMPKPRMSDHRICQVITPAIRRASTTAERGPLLTLGVYTPWGYVSLGRFDQSREGTMTDTDSHIGVLAKLERYLDTAPRAVAVSRECGPFTVFVRDSPRGQPLYARPRLAYPRSISTEEVRRMLDFQRAIGVPRALEWVHETTPTLLTSARGAGMSVQECALLRLADYTPAAAPSGYLVHEMTADDPQTGAVIAAIDASFRETDQMGPPESSLQRLRMRSGLLVLVGAFDTLGRPVGGGMHNPRGDLSELTGIGTLPAHRGRGIGTAITSALAGAALRDGQSSFLSAATQSAISVYETVGYARVGTACIATANERG